MESLTSCPCHSGKRYEKCCGPFHKGIAKAATAELLMRSRYSAYALGLYEYLLKTTHPNNPLYPLDIPLWIEEIKHFKQITLFENLIIENIKVNENTTLIIFTAKLKQKGQNASFTEESLFEKLDDGWLYKNGIHLK
jgi:SEC-C motif-containing protein